MIYCDIFVNIKIDNEEKQDRERGLENRWFYPKGGESLSKTLSPIVVPYNWPIEKMGNDDYLNP